MGPTNFDSTERGRENYTSFIYMYCGTNCSWCAIRKLRCIVQLYTQATLCVAVLLVDCSKNKHLARCTIIININIEPGLQALVIFAGRYRFLNEIDF